MTPDLWNMLKDDVAVQDCFGNPPRIFEDEAAVMDPPIGQPEEFPTYAVWQVIVGEPANKLSEAPRNDRTVVTISVIAGTQALRDAGYRAIRDVLALHGYQQPAFISYREEQTKNYVCQFDFSFWVARASGVTIPVVDDTDTPLVDDDDVPLIED